MGADSGGGHGCDARLGVVRGRTAKKGGADLFAALVDQRTSCIRRLAGGRSQQVRFSRFLHNPAVTAEEMIATAADHTARAAKGRHVLAIQDTTELNFSKHRGSKRGFGRVGNGVDIGLFLHPVVVVAADSGGILGLAEAITINRTRPVTTHRRKRPVHEKESQRWLDGLAAASQVLSSARQVTMIADRECDFYAELIAPRPDNVHLLIRSGQDRGLPGGDLLFAAADAFAVAGRRTIDVPARPGGRPARKAELAISFGSVSIARPQQRVPKEWPESVEMRLVVAREIDPPEGEKPVVWRLLTTHAVRTLADAERIIGFYRRRWIIEQVFRTLKAQGFNIEESQVLDADTMIKLATATLIAAVRVMQLVMARDGSTGQQMSDALDQADEALVEALVSKLEGATAKQKNPHPKGSLARFAWVVGRLGGWDGYVGHGYKPAGPKTMAYGLQRFDAVRHGWKLRQELPGHA